MSLPLVDIPQQGGGWFKPTEEMKDYVALLIEVIDWEADRPGQFGPKDSALVNMTIFKTEATLDAGTPDEVVEGTRIEYTMLTRDLKPILGSATVVTIAQVPPSKAGRQPAWVWRQAGADVKAKVAAYLKAKEEALDAALANAPSFD